MRACECACVRECVREVKVREAWLLNLKIDSQDLKRTLNYVKVARSKWFAGLGKLRLCRNTQEIGI